MASLIGSIPAPEAVQVLVSSLADDSPLVRAAALSSLYQIAALNPLLVLDCCVHVSRAGHRRFGNMAGVFNVMARAVRAMGGEDIDHEFMGKLVKIATAEIITSKELNVDWQRAAAALLVSIGSHVPDLMMEEIFLHLCGPTSAQPAMIQILADFASTEAYQFTPRLKDVLLRVLPILGNVRENQRPIFANAFKCWCQAAWQYNSDFLSDPLLDTDVMSCLNSAFELVLRVWASSRDMKVRLSSVEALGEMVGLITRSKLKASLPRLVPTILDLYRKDQEGAFLATQSLHSLLTACLLSENGPPLLDFEDLIPILSTLLPVACINNNDEHSDFSMGLKICMNPKMRSNAFAAYGALSPYGVGPQQQAFIEQVHATFPRLVLHLHDEDLDVRQACRDTLRKLGPLMDADGLSTLFSKQYFSSDRRSDYEDFLRDLSRQLCQHLPARVDTYLASIIQAFDAPWPVIQANAIYLTSWLLSLLEDHRSVATYFLQVFATLVRMMSRSPDSIVRATCSFGLGLLLKTSNPLMWSQPLDRFDSVRGSPE